MVIIKDYRIPFTADAIILFQCHYMHTQMLGFNVLWGLSIDIMVFILYKLYVLSPNRKSNKKSDL